MLNNLCLTDILWFPGRADVDFRASRDEYNVIILSSWCLWDTLIKIDIIFQWPFQSLKQTETHLCTQRQAGKERCQLMCVWTVSISIASVSFPAMVMWSRGCCWQTVMSSQTLSTESLLRAQHRAEFTKNRTDRSSQPEYKPLTAIIFWVWKMDLNDLNSSNYICAAFRALQFLCASQIN